MISLVNIPKRFYCFFVGMLFFVCTLQAQYNALFWKISGKGLSKPSFIYGTMHVADDRVFQFSKGVLPAFNSCKIFAMELDPDKIFAPDLIAKMMLDKSHSIQKSLPDSDFIFLDSILTKTTGLPLSIFDHLSPILISAMLEQVDMNKSSSIKNNHQDFLDLYFYKLAKQKRKKIIGIETATEQINALQSMKYLEQIAMLKEELHRMKEPISNEQNVLDLYLNGALDSLQTTGNNYNMPAEFYKAIVTDRNSRMAERIATFIQKGNSFIAIGALHLAGEKGVIALLKKYGYTVEAIK